jgi:hypothetical protein
MHFIHLIRLLIKWEGKGKFVPLVPIISFLLIALVFAGFNLFSLMKNNRMIDTLFTSSGWFLSSAINSIMSKKLSEEAQDDKYIYMRVSTWTKVFIVFGLISIAGMIYNMAKPLI